MLLSELTASARRLALVGLAKNTGKTETLAALLRELRVDGRPVGVTSVGRDGEEYDVLDARIAKPRIELAGGSLVATTDALLRAGGVPHELLERTNVRTPLGRVVIARLRGAGAIEIAGPSAAEDVRAVGESMLEHGAAQVLIDGAIDRRAASSPEVADGLVIATGAVLGQDIEQVVGRTRDAVELVRLPTLDQDGEGRRVRALAAGMAESLLVSEDLAATELPARFVLTAEREQVRVLLSANPDARWLLLTGALPERFLEHLVHATRGSRRLAIVVADPTKIFLSQRAPAWYRAQGVELRVLQATELLAVTVNPVAPQSHRFDSAELRALLREAIGGVAILDVLAYDYAPLPA